jgi:hypothetical protein
MECGFMWDIKSVKIQKTNMDVVNLMTERITHEIDMDILRQLGEESGVDLSTEIELAGRKFNTKLDRTINGMTNKTVHERNNI